MYSTQRTLLYWGFTFQQSSPETSLVNRRGLVTDVRINRTLYCAGYLNPTTHEYQVISIYAYEHMFFKQNFLTLFHCSLMFKAKCEYWARFTISYVDIISREVTLKSIEPDRGMRGRWALIEDCAQPAHLRSQVTVFSVCRGELWVAMWWL